MKATRTQEVLQEIYADHSVKQLASQIEVGISTMYKWAETCDPDVVSPVERVGCLLEYLGDDDRLIQNLCQRSGGHFVRDKPVVEPVGGLVPTFCKVEQAWMTTHHSLVDAVATGRINPAQMAVIQRHWEKQKRLMDGLVQAGLRGTLRCGVLFVSLGWWFATGEVLVVETA